MKTLSKWAQDLWAWLDGKKRIIALAYWTVMTPCLPILYPTGVPSALNKAYLITGIILSAVGLGNAAIKSYQEGRAAKVDTTVPPDAPVK